MSIFYRKVEKKNMKDPNGPKLWYPVLRSIGLVKEKEVAKFIADETTINRKEAEMSLFQFEKVLLKETMDGRTVQLGEIGSFRLTIHAVGSKTKEEVTTDKIKKITLRFTPSAYVKETLQKAHFTAMESILE